MVGPLATHVGLGEAVEFGIDQRQKALGSAWIAFVHRFEKLGDFARGRVHICPHHGHGSVEAESQHTKILARLGLGQDAGRIPSPLLLKKTPTEGKYTC
jgi:hypothetical protein